MFRAIAPDRRARLPRRLIRRAGLRPLCATESYDRGVENPNYYPWFVIRRACRQAPARCSSPVTHDTSRYTVTGILNKVALTCLARGEGK